MLGTNGLARDRLLLLGLALLSLAVPAVALAANIKVSGTAGDDLISVRVESNDRARVVLNGAHVAAASSGDTIDATTGAGDDTMIFDEVEDFEPFFSLRARLGRGDDVAVANGIINDGPDDLTTALDLDLGSGNDRLSLHNYGDTNRLVVNAGPGHDSGTVTRSGFVDSRFNDMFRLGSGNDRLRVRSTGPAQIFGGPGNDTLIGGEGDDTFDARDGDADVIRCGSGRDRVRADKSDTVSSNCERVRRS
jgi:Ca2+-binding RTX toxin-like protein